MHLSRPGRVLILAAAVLAASALGWRLAATTPSEAGGPPQTHTIEVGDFWFCAMQFENGVCETVIDAGDTVVWDFSGASATHSTRACGPTCDPPSGTPFWDSGFISDGSTFEFQFPFDQGGTYLYQCSVHPAQMRGRIVVQGNLPTPPSGVPGDVNCSDDTDAIDAALILQLSAGLLDELSCAEDGDVNGDGRIDAIDAALVLQFVAGLLDSLPPAGPPGPIFY